MSPHSTLVDGRPLTRSADAVAAATGPVVLVGNANVGKSVLFKNLTRRYVVVSNYPGTTVEVVRAEAAIDGRSVEVVDTPGVNDLQPRSEDARVTRDLLAAAPDATIVQVADAKNLRRALLLTLELAETGRPMVLVLNMLDELEERGGAVDVPLLEAILGIPVVPAIAIRDVGTDALREAIPRAAVPRLAAPEIDTADAYERSRVRLGRVTAILDRVFEIRQPETASFKVRLGFWAMQPIKGLAILAAVLVGVFWFVGLFGAGTMVDLFETAAFEQRLSPVAIRAVDAVTPFPHEHAPSLIEHEVGFPVSPVHEVPLGTLSKEAIGPAYSGPSDLAGTQRLARFFHDLLIGEYGLITMGLAYALAIVLPIVTTFFLAFSLLEDSGYFPRMAIMVNRVFRKMGLNGKAVLPMILGLGCDTMATMTTRILETRRERIVTTLLLALAVPCSAQLGVLMAMMAVLSPAASILWVAVLIGVILFVGWLTARLFGRSSGEFILEVPPLRRPQLANVWVKTTSRLKWYLQEVVPLFLIGTLALFLLDRTGALAAIAEAGRPLVVGWLGLPLETTNAFLVGFLRRDFGAVYLLDAATGPVPLLDPLQIFVAMITITLFVPCFANLLVIQREHGTAVALRMAAFIFPFAFLVGGIFRWVGPWLPIF